MTYNILTATSPSGKTLYRCVVCRHETPAPTKNHVCASITCPRCGMTSYHPGDVENLYCGNCHKFFFLGVKENILVLAEEDLRTNL